MHGHIDQQGTDGVVLLNLGTCDFFFDIGKGRGSGRCEAMRSKECWCVGNASGHGHWVTEADAPKERYAAVDAATASRPLLLRDRMCATCARGGQGQSCKHCVDGTVRLRSGDLVIFSGCRAFHGVSAVVHEPNRHLQPADSLAAVPPLPAWAQTRLDGGGRVSVQWRLTDRTIARKKEEKEMAAWDASAAAMAPLHRALAAGSSAAASAGHGITRASAAEETMVVARRGALNLGMWPGMLHRAAAVNEYWKVVVTFNILISEESYGDDDDGDSRGPPPHFTICYLRPTDSMGYPAETCAVGQPGLIPETVARSVEQLVTVARRAPPPLRDRVQNASLVVENGTIHTLRQQIDSALRQHGGGFQWASTANSDNLCAVHCTAGADYVRGPIVDFKSITFSASLAPIAPNVPLHYYLLNHAPVTHLVRFRLANLVATAETPIASAADARSISGIGEKMAQDVGRALDALRAAAAGGKTPMAETNEDTYAQMLAARARQPFSGAGHVLGGGHAASGSLSSSAGASELAVAPAAGDPTVERSLKRKRKEEQLAALERRGLLNPVGPVRGTADEPILLDE